MTALWWKIGGWVAAVSLVLGLVGGYVHQRDARLRAEGAQRVLQQQSQMKIDSLTTLLNAYKDSLQRDTHEVNRIVQRFKILHDSVRLTDTLIVERALAVADTLATVCPAALARCAQALQLASQLDTVRVERERLVVPQQPSWLQRWMRDAVLLGGGYLVGRVVH